MPCSAVFTAYPGHLPMHRVEDEWGGGCEGTLVAQTAEEYVEYLFEGHRDRSNV